jgi:5-methylthioadenosine/S-adenosylhomocysteine deaminase
MNHAAQLTLIKGGRVLDIDGELDQPPHLDILIKDGRIESIGPLASTATGPNVRVVDADQRLVIPGLVNAHYHSHDTLLRGMFEQLPLDAWMLYSGPGQFPHLSPEMVETRTALGASECLLNGITTIQDMVSLVGADDAHVDQLVKTYDAVHIRTVLALQISDRASCDCVAYWDKLPAQTMQCLPGASDFAAHMAFVEKALTKSSRLVTWGLGPSAPQRCTRDMLARIARLSAEAKLQVFTHVYEARSQAVLARLKYPKGSFIEHLDRADLLTPRLTIAHGVWITEPEIARLGAAGANLACNPISNIKLLNGFAPLTSYVTSGVNVGLGCDNCSGSDAQNLFEPMKAFALMWGMYSGTDKTSAAKEAFKAATIGSAKALGLGDEIGLLRPGYRADLVLIDTTQPNYRPLNSALRQLVYSETGRSITMVMVDGKIVVENGQITSMIHRDLKHSAEDARNELLPYIESNKRRNAAILGDILAAYDKANAYPLDFDRFSLRRT